MQGLNLDREIGRLQLCAVSAPSPYGHTPQEQRRRPALAVTASAARVAIREGGRATDEYVRPAWDTVSNMLQAARQYPACRARAGLSE